MALHGNKTNTQKQETKDPPQTNDSYKIRQIRMKIIEYTHIHVYPEAKPEQSKKKKLKKDNKLTQWTKETKSDIHQLRTKLAKEQTGKQK